MEKFTYLLAGSFLAPTLAMSGGLERSELPTSFMYEDGNYVEVTYVNRNYEITDNMFAPSKSMLDDVSSLHFATKFVAGENLSGNDSMSSNVRILVLTSITIKVIKMIRPK